jgi:hypothetical protein
MQRSEFLYGVLMFGDGPEMNTKVCRTNHKCAKGRGWGSFNVCLWVRLKGNFIKGMEPVESRCLVKRVGRSY